MESMMKEQTQGFWGAYKQRSPGGLTEAKEHV